MMEHNDRLSKLSNNATTTQFNTGTRKRKLEEMATGNNAPANVNKKAKIDEKNDENNAEDIDCINELSDDDNMMNNDNNNNNNNNSNVKRNDDNELNNKYELIKRKKLLMKIYGNILKFPNNTKYRDLNAKCLANKFENGKLCFDLLYEVGFQLSKDGKKLSFPTDQSLHKLQLSYDGLS
eukprot:535108_1